jgi:hypothetical protein
MGIEALVMGLEAGIKVFSKANVKPIVDLFGLQNVSVIECHPTSLLKFRRDSSDLVIEIPS